MDKDSQNSRWQIRRARNTGRNPNVMPMFNADWVTGLMCLVGFFLLLNIALDGVVLKTLDPTTCKWKRFHQSCYQCSHCDALRPRTRCSVMSAISFILKC